MLGNLFFARHFFDVEHQDSKSLDIVIFYLSSPPSP